MSLDSRFPEWQWGRVAQEIKRFHKEMYGVDYPLFIVGDFNGDNKDDYAMKLTILSDGGMQDIAVAFVSSDSTFSYHVLSQRKSSYEVYMFLQPRGKQYYDFEADEQSIFSHDAIGMYVFEKAGGTFIFKNGKFEVVHTSD